MGFIRRSLVHILWPILSVCVARSRFRQPDVMPSWWKFSADVTLAGLEAQRVIALRMIKLAQGGPQAATEASLMVTEKARAAAEAATKLMTGGSLAKVLRHSRTIMRANEKRLSGRARSR